MALNALIGLIFATIRKRAGLELHKYLIKHPLASAAAARIDDDVIELPYVEVAMLFVAVE